MTRRLSGSDGDPNLPAVVITAYTNDDDLEAARNEGVLAVLPKPAPVARLLELLGAARRGGLVAIIEDDAALSDNLSEVLRRRDRRRPKADPGGDPCPKTETGRIDRANDHALSLALALWH